MVNLLDENYSLADGYLLNLCPSHYTHIGLLWSCHRSMWCTIIYILYTAILLYYYIYILYTATRPSVYITVTGWCLLMIHCTLLLGTKVHFRCTPERPLGTCSISGDDTRCRLQAVTAADGRETRGSQLFTAYLWGYLNN